MIARLSPFPQLSATLPAMKLGRKVKNIRLDRKLAGQDLARACGITPNCCHLLTTRDKAIARALSDASGNL